MKLNHLRDVLAVAEFGSLRAASRHLGIAQPAMTRAIREIEHELGVTLFERHAKGAKLTPMGEAFVRRARAAQSELERAREEIDQLQGKSTGQVAMVLSQVVSIVIMPAALADFRRRYPDALLKVSENFFQAAEPELLEGRIDFYVGPLDEAISSTNLAVEKLFENKRVAVARKGNPLLEADARTAALEGHWIRPTLSNKLTEADFEDWFLSLGLPRPRIVMHCPSALVTMLAVANSNLLTIMPSQWLEFPTTAALVDPMPRIKPLPAAPICIVRRHDLPLTPMAEYLCDLMRRVGMTYAHRRLAHTA